MYQSPENPALLAGEVIWCSHCHRILTIVSASERWQDAPDPQTGNPNQYVSVLLSDGFVTRYWRYENPPATGTLT